METIHCIGDSHCCFFFGQEDKAFSALDRNDGLLSFFKVYLVGPSLAYNLCQEGTKTAGREMILDLLDNKISTGSTILLCFGEIDCRAHILKQIELKHASFEDTVRECVSRYFVFVKEVKARGFNVLLWAVVPSAPDSAPVDPSYPRYGTGAERNRVAKCFNDTLTTLARTEGIPVVSIFDDLVASDGSTNEDFFMDQIHLSQKAMPLALGAFRKLFTDLPDEALPVPVRVHVGGHAARDGWTIVNPKAGPGVDVVASAADLSSFANESVDEVYVSGHLEKLNYKTQLVPGLKEIARILKRTGMFRVSVPDFEILCRAVLHPSMSPQQRFDAMKLVFGNSSDSNDLNKVGLTHEFLKSYLTVAGFHHSRRVAEFKSLRETSHVELSGTNLMLNVEAIK